jgi:hypothetical protein
MGRSLTTIHPIFQSSNTPEKGDLAMMFRERSHEGEGRPGPGGPGAGPDGGGLDAARERAHRLADAGDAAIDNALSGDSQDFLKSTKQQGGE